MNYDADAEFAAIRLARLAVSETEDETRGVEMSAVANDMFQRHGPEGIYGLTIALARQYATALQVLANHRKTDVSTLIDDFERYKLEAFDDET